MNFPFYEEAPKEDVEACNLCVARDHWLVSTTDRYGLTAPLRECYACRLRFLSPRMTAEAYRRFYEGGHYRRLLESFYGRPFTPDNLEADQATYAGRLSAWLFGHIGDRRGGTLLDVGGSTGVVAERLCRDFQFIGTVLEAYGAEAKNSRERGLITVTAPLESFRVFIRYNVITVCQTIDTICNTFFQSPPFFPR